MANKNSHASNNTRKPTNANVLWRTAGIVAGLFTIAAGVTVLAVNDDAFDLAHILGKSNLGRENEIPDAWLTDIADWDSDEKNYSKEGKGWDVYSKYIQNETHGLNCKSGQHFDPNNPDATVWKKENVQKVYTGKIITRGKNSTFSPTYYCQLPTQFRSAGGRHDRTLGYGIPDAATMNGLAQAPLQADQDTLDFLDVSCATRPTERRRRNDDWDHCRTYTELLKKPADRIIMTSPFGPRQFGNGSEKVHGGVDLSAAPGTPVYAPHDGVVVSYGGNYHTLTIQHLLPDGRIAYTQYIHLQSALVKPGQKIKAGQQIAKTGETGAKGRPHLHYDELLQITGYDDLGSPIFADWRKMKLDKNGLAPAPKGVGMSSPLKGPGTVPINPDRNCIGVAMGAQAPSPKKEEPSPAGRACTPAYRVDFSAIAQHEVPDVVHGYVPGYYYKPQRINSGSYAGGIKLSIAGKKNEGEGAASGVTIDTGFDLGQTSPKRLKQLLSGYTAKHPERAENVDVPFIVQKLTPYMKSDSGKTPAPTGRTAFELIAGKEPYLSLADVRLMQDAKREKEVSAIETHYDRYKRPDAPSFKELPSEAQTVLVDWVWNFGSADEIHLISKRGNPSSKNARKEFWTLVYNNDWKTLKDKLLRADFPIRKDQKKSQWNRMKSRGKLLDKAIQRGWPERNAC